MKEFGQVCDAWKDMVEYLNAQRINGEELVYEKGISLDTMQRHWKQYITFVKCFQAWVLCDTGTDNEVTPPLIYDLEDLNNNWQSFTAKQLSKKNGVSVKKQKGLDACENLRHTGMGNLAAMNDKEAEGTIDLAADEDNDTKPAARKKLLLVQQQW
jgi:hypothetical protein